MLAYLYDEMPAADRDSFELHLADCAACIDDFAELSQSRYPVYEWKTTEFEPLATPRIIIPYAETAGVSWFDKLRAAFSFNPGLATAGAFATLVIAAVIGYAVITNDVPTEEVAKADVETSASPERSATNAAPAPASIDQKDEKSEPNPSRKTLRSGSDDVVKTAVKPKLEPKTVPIKDVKNSRPNRRRDLNVPVLSRFESDEDDSLRLADIFDEIGTSE